MDQAIKIESFTSLTGWQKGHLLVLAVYKITKNFPREETYALIDQMHRCAISITSNIAEGFSRKSYKEKIQFYSVALGSTTELQNQLLIARDLGYVSKEQFTIIAYQTVEVHKILNGLIKGARRYLVSKA